MPGNIKYNYTYDDADRLKNITIPGHDPIQFNIWFVNRPTSVTFPGGTTEYSYDRLSRVESILAENESLQTVMDYDYALYDDVGNVKIKNTDNGNYSYDYSDDDLYQLKKTTGPSDTEEFWYDDIGNRHSDEAMSWDYNADNQLTEHDNTTCLYDNNGSLVQKTVNGVDTTYIYNMDNRLVQVEDNSSTIIAEYYYDPFGRRLWKEDNETRTHYFYSDEGLIGEYTDNGTEIKTYGYQPNSTWTTAPLFMNVGSDYYFYSNDHLGTPQKLTDANGAIAWSATYNSFGEADVDNASTVVNNLRFPGQYFDEETGLHYNYDPGIGRYVTSDPIGLLGGINRYIYVLNNPVNQKDPYGLSSKKVLDALKKLWEILDAADTVEDVDNAVELIEEANNKDDSNNLSADTAFEITNQALETVPINPPFINLFEQDPDDPDHIFNQLEDQREGLEKLLEDADPDTACPN